MRNAELSFSRGQGALPRILKECGKIATNVPEMSLTWGYVSDLLKGFAISPNPKALRDISSASFGVQRVEVSSIRVAPAERIPVHARYRSLHVQLLPKMNRPGKFTSQWPRARLGAIRSMVVSQDNNTVPS
jgi:hypothetical protein